MKAFNQANILKVAAVTIAIPRYAGAFALSAGFVADNYLPFSLGFAEVSAGIAMSVLEGFALSFILGKWRLLKVSSPAWYALLAVSFLLALSLPLVAVPYLYFAQAGFTSVTELFSSIWLQNSWNFIVAFVPMLIVIGVGLSDVNELEREEKAVEYELKVSKQKAELELEQKRQQAKVELEISKLELEVEQAKVANELEIRKLRAKYKVEASNVEEQAKQNLTLAFVCETCGEGFEQERQLRGHKAHCKAKVNGKQHELVEVLR